MFIKPELYVERIEVEDIITTSSGSDEPVETPDEEF